MIDIHCHILPDIDDGARSLEESVALGELLVKEGVKTVVATPHVFDLRYPTPTRDQILSRLESLQAALAGRLNVVCGAEVRVVPEMMTVLDRKEIFINAGSYMLIEFPSGLIPHGAENLIFQLMTLGVRPIIAHPERNRGFLSDPDRLYTFVNMGCYAQLTSTCFLNKDRAQRLIWGWIEAGQIHVVASDSHQCQWRPPQLAEPYREVEKTCGAEVAHALFVANPQAVVNGDSLPFTPELRPINKKTKNRNTSLSGWWQGLWRS